MHIPYYLSGIELYQTEVEAALIEGDLLDKKVNDMTGYEFKTLLLATLKEHKGRKS